jgi:hypothetical protein
MKDKYYNNYPAFFSKIEYNYILKILDAVRSGRVKDIYDINSIDEKISLFIKIVDEYDLNICSCIIHRNTLFYIDMDKYLRDGEKSLYINLENLFFNKLSLDELVVLVEAIVSYKIGYILRVHNNNVWYLTINGEYPITLDPYFLQYFKEFKQNRLREV